MLDASAFGARRLLHPKSSVPRDLFKPLQQRLSDMRKCGIEARRRKNSTDRRLYFGGFTKACQEAIGRKQLE
jgi:hypothetical protein